MSNKFLSLLSSFFLLSQIFPKISNLFCKFSSQISIFLFQADTVAAIVPARMSKSCQIEFFCSSFFFPFFDQLFLFDFLIARILNKDSLERSFTKKNGGFETKTYQ